MRTHYIMRINLRRELSFLFLVESLRPIINDPGSATGDFSRFPEFRDASLQVCGIGMERLGWTLKHLIKFRIL